MTNGQLEARVRELEAENEVLKLMLRQKNTRNAGRKPYITSTTVDKKKKCAMMVKAMLLLVGLLVFLQLRFIIS